mgnify:CR=1 FL=1
MTRDDGREALRVFLGQDARTGLPLDLALWSISNGADYAYLLGVAHPDEMRSLALSQQGQHTFNAHGHRFHIGAHHPAYQGAVKIRQIDILARSSVEYGQVDRRHCRKPFKGRLPVLEIETDRLHSLGAELVKCLPITSQGPDLVTITVIVEGKLPPDS